MLISMLNGFKWRCVGEKIRAGGERKNLITLALMFNLNLPPLNIWEMYVEKEHAKGTPSDRGDRKSHSQARTWSNQRDLKVGRI